MVMSIKIIKNLTHDVNYNKNSIFNLVLKIAHSRHFLHSLITLLCNISERIINIWIVS